MMEKSGQSLYGYEDGFGMVYVHDVVVGYSCIYVTFLYGNY
jgi:hypothetical protein